MPYLYQENLKSIVQQSVHQYMNDNPLLEGIHTYRELELHRKNIYFFVIQTLKPDNKQKPTTGCLPFFNKSPQDSLEKIASEIINGINFRESK